MSRRNRSIPAGFAVLISTAMLVAPGCATYKITIKCGERINTHDVPNDDPGNILEMAIVCLSESDLRDLALQESLTDFEAANARERLKSDAWFEKGLQELVKGQVDGRAIWIGSVRPGQTYPVPALRHPRPWSKHSAVWVFANFNGNPGDDHGINRRLVRPTRWLSKNLVIVVGEKTIRWGE